MLRSTFVSVACSIVQISAATFYTELNSSDLSNNAFTPTALGNLSLGENLVIGAINEGGAFRPDAFTFTVSDDLMITSLLFNFDSNVSNHFLAFKDDSGSFDETETILFAALVSSAQNGLNILELEQDGGDVAEDSGERRPKGFELPLPNGDYTLWLQETNNAPVNYSLTLTTVAIPEPSTSTIVLLGTSLLLLVKRNRS